MNIPEGKKIEFEDIQQGDLIKAVTIFTDAFMMIKIGTADHLTTYAGKQWRSRYSHRHLASESYGGMSGSDIWSEEFFLIERLEK